MHERVLPASPNWYCSRCSDLSERGVLGFGARDLVYLVDVSASSCRVVGELVGHRGRVSGFSFCHHEGQSHMCVSSSDDGTVKFWDSDEKVVLKEHTFHQNTITAVHWSPVDKGLVVSGDEKGVVVCHWYHTGDTASFFPEPRTIFSLSCSPHIWSLVAVGYKDGMIVLIDVSKKGEVVHRLRGHDDEIHSLTWAPTAGEDGLYSRPDDSKAENGVSEGEEREEKKGCYLASGSKDQTMRIWTTTTGKGVMTLKLPYLKRRGAGVDPTVKDRLWLTVHWPRGRSMQLVSSCFSGELLLWDLTKTGKQKWSLLGASSEGQNHSRIIFNVTSVMLGDGTELLISTSMDREIKCWDLSSLDCCWTLPTLGGFVYSLTFSPIGTGCLALGIGDNMIRVWSTLSIQNQYDTRTFWQGIKSKVTALSWHPQKEGSLAFGTDDGKVGIYNAFSNKPPQVSASYHRKTVYTLAWGPPVPPMSFGDAGDRPSYTLYSCAGEGLILQHDPWQLNGEASSIDQVIRDTNDIKHKLSPHTDLSWKPDGRVVAIGNEDGSIEVYQAPSLKLLCSIQQHHKIINTLRWHPDHSSPSDLHGLLASGSSNAKVYIHDLRSVIENPPDSPVVMTEPYRTLSGHTAKVTAMAWSPHQPARLVTVCYDSTAQVWDVLTEEGLSNYRGHRGRLLCVDWSPVDPDVVWTGGDDFTVQEWSISKQEFKVPPKGKKSMDLREKQSTKAKQQQKNKKKKKTPSTGGVMAGEAPPPSVNGEGGAAGGRAAASGLEPCDEDEEEEENGSSGSPVLPPAFTEMSRKCTPAFKSKDKPELLSVKKRKPRSMLPLSTSMDHRPKEEQLQDCVTLATIRHSPKPPSGCVPGQGDHIHLGLFSDRQALYRMFQEEEQGHVEAGHYDSVIYLRLWSGDLEGALQVATERGELSDHLLSVAPMAGYEVWCRAVEAYVRQLCLQEQYLKAASHLLSINRVYEAVDLLRSHKLYREAIALVKARLPSEDPVLQELYTSWAALLEKDGHLSSAAKCYLATGASFDAAKVIAKKNDMTTLRMAASVAKIGGEDSLAHAISLRCAKDLVAAQNWTVAQQVLSTQDSLLVHRLHFCVSELLTSALVPAGTLTQSCASTHAWSSSYERQGSIQERIRAVWEEEFGVSETTPDTVGTLLQDLKAVENPQPAPTMSAKQVLMCSSLQLTEAVLCWLVLDDGGMMKAFWQTVNWPTEAGFLSLSAGICKLLFPDGDVGVCLQKFQKRFNPTEEQASAAADSLQAFLQYHLLYERWWSHSLCQSDSNQPSTQNGHSSSFSSATDAQNSDEMEKVTEGHLPKSAVNDSAMMASSIESTNTDIKNALDVSILLSEPHAAYQAMQKSMAEIHKKISNMVVQHQGPPAEPREHRATPSDPAPTDDRDSNDTEKRPEDQETLLTLSVKMSQYQRSLSDLPQTLQMYPRPDVMECCLVLLYLSRCSAAVSESLQEEAKKLLRKYGTSRPLQKASMPFLTEQIP
ncbi:gem-associated protein 5 [Lampris incognitus]|uniref:gem-associated protein 5 n=1 Tax=Lampris incognitus TaxID=2546036 RepID=UPI0024B6052D|nr:gem-associated protein 5 [Lampris incognitus]